MAARQLERFDNLVALFLARATEKKHTPFLWANNSINANTDPSDFDLQGRYYWCSVTVKF